MADIFVSYKSSDRPRAETLKTWFEEAGWTVWIDRTITVGAQWADEIDSALEAAKAVVVIWGAQARRSPWVLKEAEFARNAGTLVQIHATGLPLLPPFDTLAAVRMPSWSGEAAHSERVRLLEAVAAKLHCDVPDRARAAPQNEALGEAFHLDVMEALGLAFYYCARQVERARRCAERGHSVLSDFEDIKPAFDAMLALASKNASETDDRDGALHMLIDDFLDELQRLAPDPGAVR